MVSLFLCLALWADDPVPVKGAPTPEEIQAYLKLEDEVEERMESLHEIEILRLKDAYRKAAPKARPGINDSLELVQKSLANQRKTIVRAYLSEAPQVGMLGYIESAHILSFPEKTVGFVRLDRTHITGFKNGEAIRTTKSGYVLVDGLDSEKLSDGQAWKPTSLFRAERVDRGKLTAAGVAKLNALAAVKNSRKPVKSPDAQRTSFIVLKAIDVDPIDKAREEHDAKKLAEAEAAKAKARANKP